MNVIVNEPNTSCARPHRTGFDSISYVYSADSSKTQEELAELVAEKFTAWKKDCKLKSKVTDLKKSNYYQQQMSKYTKLKMLQNKTTAEAARKQHLAAFARAKEEKAKAKKAAEEKKEAEEKEAGIGQLWHRSSYRQALKVSFFHKQLASRRWSAV